MTEIAFHHSIPDRPNYLCRLLRKAYVRGAQVTVFGDERSLQTLSTALWTMGDIEFVPHSLWSSSVAEQNYSPILLTPDLSDSKQHQALLNIDAQTPKGFESFDKLLEVVSLDTTERAQARKRLAFYKERGYHIAYHAWKA